MGADRKYVIELREGWHLNMGVAVNVVVMIVGHVLL